MRKRCYECLKTISLQAKFNFEEQIIFSFGKRHVYSFLVLHYACQVEYECYENHMKFLVKPTAIPFCLHRFSPYRKLYHLCSQLHDILKRGNIQFSLLLLKKTPKTKINAYNSVSHLHPDFQSSPFVHLCIPRCINCFEDLVLLESNLNLNLVSFK